MVQADTPLQTISKHTSSDVASRLIHVAVVGMGVLFFVVLMAWLIVSGRPASLELHFNPYALLSAASLASNLMAFVLIVRIKERTDVLLWFSVFLLSLMAWAAPEMMLRLSSTPAAATFWAPFTTLGAVLMPISLYMFALAYTNAKRTLSPFVLPTLIVVSALFIFADAHSKLLAIYNPSTMKAAPWGFVTQTGPAYFLISLWLILLSLAALIMLAGFRRHTVEPTLRRQARLFMIAIAIPLFIGALTDGLLPALNDNLLPALTVTLLTIMGIIVTYGILKYRFFSFTPGLIASEILSTMNEAVIGITPDFRLSYANVGAERLLGLSAAELTNQSLQDLLAEAWTSAQLHEKIFDQLADQAFYTLDSVNFHSAAGGPITTKLSITKVVGEGQPYGYLLVLTDITALAQTKAIIERKVLERTRELHEEQAKLRASIEGLKLGFALIDNAGEVIIQNKALRTIFNLTEPAISIELLQKHVTGIDLAAESQQVQASGKLSNIRDISLGTKILQIFMGPVDVGEESKTGVIGTVLLIEDITEATIQARSKDEFFSIASHELRTPLTAIRGNASMIQTIYTDVMKDKALAQMVDDIHESSTRLIGIVNDFLDVSSIEQGKVRYKLSEVRLDTIIEKVMYEMKTTLQDKKLSLDIEPKTLDSLPAIAADSDRVQQVIYDLVGNAIKFTEKGGITVTTTKEGAMLKVAVADTGRGIPVESQKLLFHKFQQASGSLLTRDTTKGTGLGLYISKLLVEGMGGQMSLEHSEEGKGSTFSFTLPIATKEKLAELQTATPKTNLINSHTGLTQSTASGQIKPTA